MRYGLSINLALLALHVFVGAMIFAHGWAKVFRGGRLGGTAKWFDAMGMRPGRLHAVLAAGTEMTVGVLLVLGLLTPIAAAGLVGLMVVAIVAVHWKNGFFITKQGYEYCLALIVLSLALGALGAGRFSIDHLVRADQPFTWLARPSHGLAVTALVGLGSGLLQLVVAFRPPKSAKSGPTN